MALIMGKKLRMFLETYQLRQLQLTMILMSTMNSFQMPCLITGCNLRKLEIPINQACLIGLAINLWQTT